MHRYNTYFSSRFLLMNLIYVFTIGNNLFSILLTSSLEPVKKEILSKCNPCVLSPCMNGAVCQLQGGRQFSCECPPGYHGKLCEHMIDACYGNPCRNGGSCRLLEEGRFRLVLILLFQLFHCFCKMANLSNTMILCLVAFALLDSPVTDARQILTIV